MTDFNISDVPAPDNDKNLNPDAIYAALVFLREYSESDEGAAAYQELLEREDGFGDWFRNTLTEDLPEGHSIRCHPIPAFTFSPDLLEDIFPDERLSVEYGLELARHIIYGPDFFNEGLASEDGPTGQAVRRFLADRAH